MKKTILAIGAHPDDIEIGCGGTLALLKSLGHSLIHILVTSGEEGSSSIKGSELARTRENEAAESAKHLDADRVIFLREPDGLSHYSKETRVRMIRLIRDLRPDVIFTHAQSDLFSDHQIVFQLTIGAIAAAAGPWYSEAGSMTHQVSQVYGYEVWNPIARPQLVIDISAFMERKIDALRAHRSQIQAVDYVTGVTGLAQYRASLNRCGNYAEAFEVIRTEKIL